MTAKGAGNVVLEEMRDVGLEGPSHVVEEFRSRGRRGEARDGHDGNRAPEVARTIGFAAQYHRSALPRRVSDTERAGPADESSDSARPSVQGFETSGREDGPERDHRVGRGGVCE
jgi:hypothetical protein